MTQAPAQPASSPATSFISAQVLGLMVPVTAGVVAFGWRAVICLVLVTGGAALGWCAWRLVGRRGRHLHVSHTLWLGLLLGALLPAHLAGGVTPDTRAGLPLALWPALPAAGLLLAGLSWLLGGTPGGRINPALVCYLLLLVVLGGGALSPHLVLRNERAVIGDLLDYRREPPAELAVRPWVTRPPAYVSDATWQVPASDRLSLYTVGIDQPERRQFTLESLMRDRMPPMEDLIVLGQPTPIGLASAAAVISGGLFLIFRGVADARIPVLALSSAYLTLAIAPVPAAITTEGPMWTWLPGLGGTSGFSEDGPWLRLGTVGWDVGLTFVHYELLAGPMLFIAFFLAPLPSLRPLAGRWRVAYALLLGPMMALAQLYGSVAFGPFIALLAVSLLTPTIDRLTQARTIV
jgi:Na+-translocating ferredoxin:NAD+ oxidoreductase RnfD subunit